MKRERTLPGKTLRVLTALLLICATLTAMTLPAFAIELKTGIGIVETSGLRLRAKPNTDCEILANASYGDSVVIIRDAGDFYLVDYNLQIGYMAKQYITFKERENIELGYANVIDSAVNMRSAPSSDGELLAQLMPGDQPYIIGFNCGWYKVTFGGDTVKSYFGLRDIRLDGFKYLINGKSVFQRLVLDQGFYRDGIYTAPDDSDMIKDIEISLAAGFNGARLHQKVFEQRFLYHCDRLGYIVWGEYPNWGLDYSAPDAIYGILPEWCEEVERDFNHPSIIGWCPFNETWDYAGREQRDELLEAVYKITKQLDSTRPCIDTSGNFHVMSDIFDVHDYEQDPKIFKENYDKLVSDGTLFDRHDSRQKYAGEPTFVSEYGGIKWVVGEQDENAWGYGNAPRTENEFIERYRGLTEALLGNELMFGFCYTQLYDIEQEQNGLYTYDREPKFDMTVFHGINSAKAAIEE